MSTNVIIYARYSTDRQDEQSIETQLALGRDFASARGWTVEEVFEDRAISGTKLKSRPGIQAVLHRIKRGGVNVLLCMSVDRISRDMEHSSAILKQLRHRGVELWTVQNAAPVNDMELGLRSIISHDMIEQTRYKTREGMKTAVRKGKAAGGIAYGYRAKLVYDDRGDRIPGLREIDEEQAEIVRWIFQQYVLGRSPKDMAIDLNKRAPQVPGPRGLRWRDTAIRGSKERGSGILNNETYVGRLVFNRRKFSKNPETEQREARMNAESEWVVSEVPELRIIDDELWAKVKQRQIEVEALFDHTKTNRLNRTHRPSYLLSGLIECAHCGGPYAIMAKDRYGCTNRQKKLPIDHLGDIVCPNSKTISRNELEGRVLDAIPARLLSPDNTASIQDEINKQLKAARTAGERDQEKLQARLQQVSRTQDIVAAQITERLLNGHSHVEAFNRQLDELQKQRNEIEASLARSQRKRSGPAKPIVINPAVYTLAIAALTTVARTGASQNDDVQRHFNFLRELVQKVVIAPSADSKSADLTIHGRLAGVLASMQAFQEHSAGSRERHKNDFARRVRAGDFVNNPEKLAFLDRFRAILVSEEAEWRRLQVSVVAGAGFEPAAFRL